MISFVVPVYNVEKSLNTCVDSLLAQEIEMEIILIDDGSKDGSSGICDDYAARDPRVRVEHHANGGLSRARNRGMDIAQGEYVWFVDSDDWIDPGCAAVMLHAAEEAGADITVCGMSNDYTDDGYTFKSPVRFPGVYRSREEIAEAIFRMDESKLFAFVTDKLYATAFLRKNDVRFDNIRTPVEDILFNIRHIETVNCIAMVDIAPYHYVQYANSSMVRKYTPGLFEVCRGVNVLRRKMYADLGLNREEHLNCLAEVCFRQDMHGIKNLYRKNSAEIRKERKKVWAEILASEEFRDELRRCRSSMFEARLVSFACRLGRPAAASRFFAAVMFVRDHIGPLYKPVRNRLILKNR